MPPNTTPGTIHQLQELHMGAGAIPLNIEKLFRDRKKSKHSLQVYTADAGYNEDNRVDVSFHGGQFFLMPPKEMLLDYKFGRIDAAHFQKEYFKILEDSFIQYQHNWNNLLDETRIVLVCSCNADDATCQRHFLIKFLEQ
ncbi:MAG: hypothetical protein GY868_12440, partial [Deltaproteobacteria bacterium]|nr:hypothetical protein [Deltaproteobacteria bacterium]